MSDNTTSNQSSTGDSKSTPGAVPSSTDGSSSAPIGNSVNSVDQTSVSTDKQHGNQNVPQSSGAYSGQNYNANYQGYGNNPNYNNNYNNNNNNPNYYHKTSIIKTTLEAIVVVVVEDRITTTTMPIKTTIKDITTTRNSTITRK